jgi:hypothetical protein
VDQTTDERLHRLACVANEAMVRADGYKRRLDDAERIIASQQTRIEELSLLLGERDKGPGEVRA